MAGGEDDEAIAWTNDVRARNALLTREDFFRAFPMKSDAMRTRISTALQTLGF